jgi:hypothetical protein
VSSSRTRVQAVNVCTDGAQAITGQTLNVDGFH